MHFLPELLVFVDVTDLWGFLPPLLPHHSRSPHCSRCSLRRRSNHLP